MITSVQNKRIRGLPVPILVPVKGPVFVVLVGEAPGPRGADKSGFPFFGDAAGRHLYQALMRLGALTLSRSVEGIPWNGSDFSKLGIVPTVHGVALDNAFDHCPSDDGMRFRAPSSHELLDTGNMSRLMSHIEQLRTRGLRGVVTLGKVATRTMEHCLRLTPDIQDQVKLLSLPHPSAQGLLSMAPNRGKGARMADLQEQWIMNCIASVREAGYTANQAMHAHQEGL